MNQEKPKWMTDPLVADIDSAKLEFLQSIVFETQGKSQKELLPLLMNVIKKGKTKQISFSDAEISAIVDAIKRNSTQQEAEQINKFMALRQMGMF